MATVPKLECTAEELYEWLNSNGFEAFSEKFQDEEVDGESLAFLTEHALESLVNKVGPRMKLLRVIKAMKAEAKGDSTSSNCSSYSDMHSCSESTSDSGMEVLQPKSPPMPASPSPSKRTWVTPFCLPERFPPKVQEELAKNLCLSKPVRIKFIQCIYDRICLFTITPTPDQRREVCKAIVTKFPFLADIGGGYETWYRQFGDKVKNELRNERSDPIVLARKRKLVGSPDISTKSPTTRRGIINWEPPVIDGEDEHSYKAHVAWMQKEFKKRQPNMGVVTQKMARTFSFRRKIINNGKHSLSAINAKYPFLFHHDQLTKEYERLLSDVDVIESIKGNISELTPKILKVGVSKDIPKMNELLSSCVNEDGTGNEHELSDAEKTVVAFCTLPLLLEKETKKNPDPVKCLYQTADNAERLVKEPGCPMSPFLIFIEDDEGRVDRIHIAGEREVLAEANNVFEAIACLMFIYYVCNLEYPKECFNTFLFLQRSVLKVFDRVKVPTKVLMFLNELHK